MGEQHYRVGELAHLCGVNRRTIDFYTQAGLLLPVKRSPGGHRFYGVDAVRKLRLIKALQAQGLSLGAIRGRLADVGAEADMVASIEQLEGELRRMESELTALRPRLASADATQLKALHAVLVTAMGYTLALSREFAELLGWTGIGPF
jgi:MerR family copper efflux transcriptional regulator